MAGISYGGIGPALSGIAAGYNAAQDASQDRQQKNLLFKEQIESLVLSNDEKKQNLVNQQALAAGFQKIANFGNQPTDPDKPTTALSASTVDNKTAAGAPVSAGELDGAARNQTKYGQFLMKKADFAAGLGPMFSDYAAKLRSEANAATTQGREMQKDSFEEDEKNTKRLSASLSGVKDQSSYLAALAVVQGDPRTAPMLAGLQLTGDYNQDADKLAVIERRGLAVKDALDFDLNRKKTSVEIAELQTRSAHEAALTAKERFSLQQAQKDATEAAGVGGGGMTTERRTNAGQALTGEPVTQMFPGMAASEGRKRDLATSDAKKLLAAGHPEWTPEQVGAEFAQRQLDWNANKSTTVAVTKQLATVEQAVAQLEFNTSAAREDLKGLSSSEISPIINAIARGEEKWTGDPKYSQLFFHVQAAAMESARILSGGTGSVAALHEGAAEEGRKMANTNMTPASLNAVFDSMSQEGVKRVSNAYDVLNKHRLKGTVSSGGGESSDGITADEQAALDRYK